MKKRSLVAVTGLLISIATGCGLKVINPNDQNKNEGTLALDVSDGKVGLVATYTCKLVSMGNRFSALGKTEEDARKEVLAKCQGHTLLSFCKAEKITCVKN
ncbi:hypothetical protein [Bdellovibrio sp. HCB2-146]|uniref:hypothetical protein n=1 Tax=Bdellovibrio sp. HCB2-146 TaxID=3394362 RepID=UPI0039BC85F2